MRSPLARVKARLLALSGFKKQDPLLQADDEEIPVEDLIQSDGHAHMEGFSKEGPCMCCRECGRCCCETPLGWIGCCCSCCAHSAIPNMLLTLGFSMSGFERMRAIEDLMHRLACSVPRNPRALQLGTDVLRRFPLLRKSHLGISGGSIDCQDASEIMGGGEWLWQRQASGPGKSLREVMSLPRNERRLIFYIHGGAFVLCNPATHRSVTRNLANVTQELVLVIEYRKPPDHPHPAGLDDVCEIYRKVIKIFPPSGIIVAGESAGGNLAVCLCLKISALGLEKPAGIILMSPWLDLSETRAEEWERSKDYLHPELMEMFANCYTAGDKTKLKDPSVSPIWSKELCSLPRTFITYGGDEILASQCSRFTKLLRKQDVDVEEYCAQGMVHGFPIFADAAYGHLGRTCVSIYIFLLSVLLICVIIWVLLFLWNFLWVLPRIWRIAVDGVVLYFLIKCSLNCLDQRARVMGWYSFTYLDELRQFRGSQGSVHREPSRAATAQRDSDVKKKLTSRHSVISMPHIADHLLLQMSEETVRLPAPYYALWQIQCFAERAFKTEGPEVRSRLEAPEQMESIPTSFRSDASLGLDPALLDP